MAKTRPRNAPTHVREGQARGSADESRSYLLDINVILALFDPLHTHHERAHAWFAEHGQHAWATCPSIEKGVIRIACQPGYNNSPGPAPVVAGKLSGLRTIGRHRFWPDAISLLDSDRVDIARLGSAAQITDTYLLALAVHHGGQLASFDRRLITTAVRGGGDALHLIA